MLVHPGHHLGDSWFHVGPDGTAHAFYLVCPDDVPRHTAWDIARATSTDLVDWTLHGVVLERGADDAWDGGCLATGSVLATRDGYLLAYTARWGEPTVAIGLAASPDLVSWTKQPGNPASRPGPGSITDRPWNGRPGTHWRDPFLRQAADGTRQMLVTAARSDRDADVSGAVAVVVQQPDGSWAAGPPLDVEPVARELECPQVVEVDGGWFLVFSTWPHLFGDAIRADHGLQLRGGTYAMAGDGPDGPFRLVHAEPIVSAGHPVQPYAGQVVAFRGRHVLLGTVWRDGGPDHLCDPIPIHRDGDRLTARS